ncbi:probable 28S rRNA (cytosine-C(5))-methyltransferase [Coccomyxa sp. Obi]|nr:probable 28S rRNA (cytosine-C(5))-methyltransferase [Coccomyxa sp. Obi]
MGKKKPVSILKRSVATSEKVSSSQSGVHKRKKQAAITDQAQVLPQDPPQKKHKATGAPHARDGSASASWHAASVVDRQAASAIAKLLHADATGMGGASLKSLTLGPTIQAKKATYAVTCETLRMLPVLRVLVTSSGLLRHDPRLSQETAFVLCYELLFGEGLRQKGPAERLVLSARQVLNQQLAAMTAEAGVADVRDLIRESSQSAAAQQRPRSARVNTLKMSVAEALSWLRTPKGKASTTAAELGQQVTVDDLLPDVLLFPPASDLHDHPLVKSSCLILQSKASCMPAHALAPQPGWDVLDACAAPGNKTTHLAALMQGRGRVLAFDKDARRLQRLEANAAATGADCITARLADFLQLPLSTSPEFRNVKGALVDPSCSGSGTTLSRMDYLLPSHTSQRSAGSAAEPQSSPPEPGITGAGQSAEAGEDTVSAPGRGENSSDAQLVPQLHGGIESKGEGTEQPPRAEQVQEEQSSSQGRRSEEDRLERLARFQEAAVRHALTLPALQRLVYSTCSVHERENEAVVAAVLPHARKLGFDLVDPFPAWLRRGVPGSVEGAEKLVRTDAVEDGTDGFFLAVFQRKKGMS